MEEDVPTIDLESQVASYSGHARIYRLIHIADKRQGQPIELEALKLALDEVKKTENLVLYQVVLEKIAGRLGPEYALDRQWVTNVERTAQSRQERLESELASSKANLIKESIRQGHSELGDHFYKLGDLQNAFKCYVRVRDYCATPKHIISMCFSIIRANIEMGNYLHVGNYVQKAEQTPDAQSDPVVVAKLAAASGLGMLAGKRYKPAAKKLLEVTADLGSHFNDVLAMQDVALYAALCALATFDRGELERLLIKNVGFKELLDTVPEIREVCHHFHSCRYAQALSALSALAPSFHLDPHLDAHVLSLMQQIRQHALIQYTSPFKSVKLDTMARAFNTTASDLGKELSTLIMDGHIHARIDAHAGVLHARQTDVRATTFAKALSLSQQYVAETKAALLRVDILAHDFLQKPKGGMGGGERGRGGALGFGDMGPGHDLPAELRGMMGGPRGAQLRGARTFFGSRSERPGGHSGGGAMDRDDDDEGNSGIGLIGGLANFASGAIRGLGGRDGPWKGTRP